MSGNELLTLPEVAEELRVDVSTLAGWIKQRMFRTVRTPNGQRRIARREVDLGMERLHEADEGRRMLGRIPDGQDSADKVAVQESMNRFFAQEEAHGVIIAHNRGTGQ
jgi:hypothetical protein